MHHSAEPHQRMIVKNRKDPSTFHRKRQPLHSPTHSESKLRHFNAAQCNAIQWVFCILCTSFILLMVYSITSNPTRSRRAPKYLHSDQSPLCSPLQHNVAALEDPQTFLNLLHTRFIPTLSISSSIDPHSDQWINSMHSVVTRLVIIKQKRHEFETKIKSLWNNAMNIGRFSYSVNALPTNVLHSKSSEMKDDELANVAMDAFNPFDVGFELVFNGNRVEKLKHKSNAQNEANQPINVYQEWNENSFNFYRIEGGDVLMVIDDITLNFDNVHDITSPLFQCYDDGMDWNHQHLVVINKYPIGPFSGLFIPNIGEQRVQLLSKETLRRGIAFSNNFESPHFRIGFNSMGAMASVNHLHFQFWRVHSVSKEQKLPIEILMDKLEEQSIGVLYLGEDVVIREIMGYPVHGLVYERNTDKIAEGIKAEEMGVDVNVFVDPLWQCIEYLIERNIPHNLLMNRDRTFLFVRREETPSAYPIFYGFSDVSGWITILDEKVFNEITVKDIWQDMKSRISIRDDDWQSVKAHCKSIS